VKSLVFISILGLCALSAAVAADEQREIAATVDEFCSWTGLKRVSELRDIGHWKSMHDSGGNARFDLLVDGKRTQYRLIFFWQHGRAKIYSIEPENYDWHGHGVGFDTLKDPKIRKWAEAAAKKVNAHLKWKSKTTPAPSSAPPVATGGNVERVIVTGSNIPTDPYITFLVSAKGTVFAAFMNS
jgi:hypothetical protein